MLTSQNDDLRWKLATIVESGNHRLWGWTNCASTVLHLCFVMFFWLLFLLRMWNQNFFHFHAGKFSSGAPINVLDCDVKAVHPTVPLVPLLQPPVQWVATKKLPGQWSPCPATSDSQFCPAQSILSLPPPRKFTLET